MANEIRMTLKINHRNPRDTVGGDLPIRSNAEFINRFFDQAVKDVIYGVTTAPTSNTPLDFSDINDPGFLLMINIGSFPVSWGPGSPGNMNEVGTLRVPYGLALLEMYPGEAFNIRAEGGASTVEWWIWSR